MKKTRRFLILTLALTLILTVSCFTSCGQKTTFQLVSEALEKTNALDSMEAEMVMNMNMSIPSLGTTVEIPLTTNIKAAGMQGEAPVIDMDMTMSMMGMEIAMDMYFEGEYVYMSMMGSNFKVKAAEMEDYDAMSDISSTVKALPEEWLKDIVATENADGSKTVALDLTDEQLESVYSEMIDSVKESAASGATITDCTFSDASLEITVAEDGYISVYKLTFVMDLGMDIEGVNYDSETGAEIIITYHNPGQSVTVTAPEGYQDYEEVDAEDVGLS